MTGAPPRPRSELGQRLRPGPDIRLVVFDLDGTLVDSSRDLATAVNAALLRLAPGRPPLREDVLRSFIGNGARNLVTRSLAHVGADVAVDDALPVFLEQYRGCLLDHTRLYPGAAEALAALEGSTLAVLTNKPGDMSRQILEGLGVGHRFARVYGGGDLPDRKPHPGGLLRLLEEAGAAPAEAVMVGDSAVDVRTGRAAGVRTIGVRYGFDPDSFRETPPDALLDDLRDLPAALGRASVLP